MFKTILATVAMMFIAVSAYALDVTSKPGWSPCGPKDIVESNLNIRYGEVILKEKGNETFLANALTGTWTLMSSTPENPDIVCGVLYGQNYKDGDTIPWTE